MTRYGVVVVGAGHGGAQTCIALRQAGYAGSVALIGDEQYPPYERPALSKEYLAGHKTFARLLIRPETFWIERGITLIPNTRVIEVDAAGHKVRTEAGDWIGYDHLVWSAGGTPRRLCCVGGDLAGVHAVRTRADVDALVGELPVANRIVVVGGGYIGLEAAAVLIEMGKTVTIVEAHDRVLQRVAGAALSKFFEDQHRARGVGFRMSSTVTDIEGANGRVTAVRLDDGERLPADIVIVGIGIEPHVAPLIEAGAEGGNGVDVDAQCRTSLPHVFAIGDCANHENAFADGARMRLESVQNATDQAAIAVGAIMGGTTGYAAVPWFWSHQFDLKLQTIGLSAGHDQVVVRGSPATRSFAVVYLKSGTVIALDCVNMVRDYVQGRRLIVERLAPDQALLSDTAVPLKTLVHSDIDTSSTTIMV